MANATSEQLVSATFDTGLLTHEEWKALSPMLKTQWMEILDAYMKRHGIEKATENLRDPEEIELIRNQWKAFQSGALFECLATGYPRP